ncbi:MAG: hypothetical protein IJB99_05310, partial [Clostridia bacterium]|nr:hypothetical protein [Clostridia bacterium]
VVVLPTPIVPPIRRRFFMVFALSEFAFSASPCLPLMRKVDRQSRDGRRENGVLGFLLMFC